MTRTTTGTSRTTTVLEQRKDVDGAETAYLAALAVDPGHARALHRLGMLTAEHREDFDGAEAMYCAAIDAEPALTDAHTRLGFLLKDVRKDIDGAEAAFRAAIDFEINRSKAASKKAHRQAADVVRQAEEETARAQEADHSAAMSAIDAKIARIEDAMREAAQATEYSQARGLQLEVEHLQASKVEGIYWDVKLIKSIGKEIKTVESDQRCATAARERAVSKNAISSRRDILHCNLGDLLYEERGDVDGAEAAYRVGVAEISLGSRGSRSLFSLAKLLLEKGDDIDTAEAILREIMKKTTGHASAHYALGNLLEHKRNNIDGALAAYLDATNVVSAAGIRGTLWYSSGKDWDPNFYDLAEHKRSQVNAHLSLGALQESGENGKKDRESAEVAYRAAVEVDPGNADAHCVLATLLLRKAETTTYTLVERKTNTFIAAAAQYRAAIAADPGHAVPKPQLASMLLFQLGPMLESQGDFEGAVAQFKESAGIYEGFIYEGVRIQ